MKPFDAVTGREYAANGPWHEESRRDPVGAGDHFPHHADRPGRGNGSLGSQSRAGRDKGCPTSGTAPTSHGHGGGSREGGEGQSDCGGRRNASFSFPERGGRCHFHEPRCPAAAIPANPKQCMRREELDDRIPVAG